MVAYVSDMDTIRDKTENIVELVLIFVWNAIYVCRPVFVFDLSTFQLKICPFAQAHLYCVHVILCPFDSIFWSFSLCQWLLT